MTIQELFNKAKKATQTAESAQAMASENVLATVEVLCNAIVERDKKIAELQKENEELKSRNAESYDLAMRPSKEEREASAEAET